MLLLTILPGAVHAQAACLNDSDARDEVQTHKLVTVLHAIATAREKTKGELLSAHLCRRDNGYVYRISILGRDGRVDRLLINASNGHVSD